MALEQDDKVGSYFDEISRSYPARYRSENPLHNCLIRKRLRAAAADLIFKDKVVLDLGAGTGGSLR
jgi:ubiquinone/menaquinone biosynthesis C-methylase UbiE